MMLPQYNARSNQVYLSQTKYVIHQFSVFNKAGPGLSGHPKLSKTKNMQKNSQIRLVIARDLWSMQGFPKS